MFVSGVLSAASFTLVLEKLVNELSKWNPTIQSDEGKLIRFKSIVADDLEIEEESIGTRIFLSVVPFLLFSLGYAIVYLNDKYTPKFVEKYISQLSPKQRAEELHRKKMLKGFKKILNKEKTSKSYL